MPDEVVPFNAASHTLEPASRTGARTGRTRRGRRVSRTRRPADSAPYRTPGTGQPDGGQQARRRRRARPPARARRRGTSRRPTGRAGAQGAGVPPRRPCPRRCRRGRCPRGAARPRAFARLDRHAALDRQHRREQEGHPEDPGAACRSDSLVGPDGEGQEHQNEKGKGDDLPQRDPRSAPRSGGPCPPPARRHATLLAPPSRSRGRTPVGTAVSVMRRPPGSSLVTRPPPMETTRSASGTES